MPFIKNFKSTNIWKAFVLNSIATTIIIFVSITTKNYLDNYTTINYTTSLNSKNTTKYSTDQDHKIIRKTNFQSILITLLITFSTSMLAYTIMYILFGFGGGMLVPSSTK